MNAADLKAEAMAWLRFGKRMSAVCTELKVYGGSWIPDVIGASPTSVVEIEVKLSRADLRTDFVSKSSKLFRYQKAEETQASNRVPNYFHYMVPAELRDYAVEVVKERLPQAGVLVYRPDFEVLPGRNVEVARAAQRLHPAAPSPTFLHEVFLRTTSELVGARVALVQLRRELDAMLERVENAVVDQARRHAGALDIEDPGADLEARAAELASAVASQDWQKLEAGEKETWRTAAQRLLESRRWAPEEWHQALRR